MDKATVRKYAYFITGTFLMGIGIGMCDHADLGVDPMSVLVTGMHRHIPVSFGTVNLMLSALQLLFTFLFCRKRITTATFIAVFTTSIGIDAFNALPLKKAETPSSILWLIAGILVYCFAIATDIYPDCGNTSYDGVIFSTMKIFDCSYHVARWIDDLFYILSGLLFGGSLGPGTLAVALCSGFLIERFLGLYHRKRKEI